MITKEQMELFETFGFLVLRQVFSPEEMEKIISDFDSMIEKLGEGSRGPKVFGTDGFGEFIEKHPSLANLAEDDRIYETIEQLLGPVFVALGVWQFRK